MEEKEIQNADAFELPVQGSGNILSVERKKQNKSVEDIADELNLSVTQIRTIELDQTDGLPEPTYVRGYIRSYANLLGLNPEKVLENYLNPNWRQTSRLDEIPRGIASAEEDTSNRGSKLKRLFVFLLIACLVGFLWFSGYLDKLTGTNQETNSIAVTSELQNDDVDAVGDIDLSDSVATEQFDQLDDEEVDQTDSDEVAATAITTAELVLNFTQTSWVDIRDGDDSRLAYKSYVTGDELIVSSDGLMSVFIGNAEGVSVQYNGEQFDISQYREGVYAKFVVNDN